VEGLFPWWPKGTSPLYALKIYCDTPAEVRLARRRRRDVEERGRDSASIERQWCEHSEPMFARYVQPQRRNADFILGPNLPLNELERLVARIRSSAGLDA
jgi:uridine kinase